MNAQSPVIDTSTRPPSVTPYTAAVPPVCGSCLQAVLVIAFELISQTFSLTSSAVTDLTLMPLRTNPDAVLTVLHPVKKTKMWYKQAFKQEWLQEEEFKSWLQADPSDKFSAVCVTQQ